MRSNPEDSPAGIRWLKAVKVEVGILRLKPAFLPSSKIFRPVRPLISYLHCLRFQLKGWSQISATQASVGSDLWMPAWNFELWVICSRSERGGIEAPNGFSLGAVTAPLLGAAISANEKWSFSVNGDCTVAGTHIAGCWKGILVGSVSFTANVRIRATLTKTEPERALANPVPWKLRLMGATMPPRC